VSFVPELLFYFLIVTAQAPGLCEEREYTTLEACRRLQRAHELAPFFGAWFGQEKGVSECYAKAPAARAVVTANYRSEELDRPGVATTAVRSACEKAEHR
jgi:hypothetical protein